MVTLAHPGGPASCSGISLVREHAGNRIDETSPRRLPTNTCLVLTHVSAKGSAHTFFLKTLPYCHPLTQGTFCHPYLLTHHSKAEDANGARRSFCPRTSYSSPSPTQERELLFFEHPELRKGLPILRAEQNHPNFHRILQAPALAAGGAQPTPTAGS